MNTSMLLLGILPLLLFVIVDTFFDLKKALIVACVFAFLEAIYSIYYFGEMDWITGAGFIFILILSVAAWKTNNDKYFLFQPVILSVGIGLFLIISYGLGHPFFLEMTLKYRDLFPEPQRSMIDNPNVQVFFDRASMVCGWAFFAHAGATAYAALKLNKWWWIAFRGIGFYVFMVIAFLIAKLFM